MTESSGGRGTLWSSLTAKAIALLILVIAAVSSTVGAYFSRKLTANFHGELDRRGSSLLETLERHQDLHLAISLKDKDAALRVLTHTLSSNDDIAYLAALDADHHVFAAVTRLSGDPAAVVLAQLPRHGLAPGAPLNQGEDSIRRFTQPVLPFTSNNEGLDLPGASGADNNNKALLGHLVLGLDAGQIARDVGMQSVPVVLTGLSLVVAFGAFFWFISRRIGRMVKFAEALASGDMKAELPDRSGDELGRLAIAIRQLRDSTVSVVHQLRDGAQSLDTSSSEVLASAHSQLDRANRQAASVTETGATVAELREIFQQAKAKAEGVIELARASDASSSEGDRAVQQSVRAMEEMRDQVVAMAKTLERLVEQTQQIGDIVDVVNGLAEQSGMLALNAAIEAVRAGEAGKGFAVVAREVRSLSDRSQQSTAQIQAILDEIEKAARESTAVVDEGRRKADSGVQLAQAAGVTIRELAQAISQSSTAAMQIAASTQQQGVGVEQIWQAIREIDKSSGDATTGISQLQQASEAIKKHSDRMQLIVRRYQVPEKTDNG